MLYQTTDSATL